MEHSFYYEDGIGTLRNEDNVIVDDPMEDIHTNITDPRIVLETITSHKQYEPKEDPSPESEKTKKSRADPNADHSLATRIAFMDRMLEQPGGARNARLIRGNLSIHEKTAQELRKDWGCFYQKVNSQYRTSLDLARHDFNR